MSTLRLINPNEQDLAFWRKMIDILQRLSREDNEKMARHLAETFNVYSKG